MKMSFESQCVIYRCHADMLNLAVAFVLAVFRILIKISVRLYCPALKGCGSIVFTNSAISLTLLGVRSSYLLRDTIWELYLCSVFVWLDVSCLPYVRHYLV